MVDFASLIEPNIALHDQIGPASNRAIMPNRGTTAWFEPPNNPVPLARAPAGEIGISDGSRTPKATPATRLLLFGLSATSTAQSSFWLGGEVIREVNRHALPAVRVDWASQISDTVAGKLGLAVNIEWFDKLHVQPGRLDLGNVLSTQVRTIEFFNAFRRPRLNVDWLTFVNNVGTGVSVTNLPGLPFTINSFASFIADVQISTAGPPSISGTLDFGFDVPISATIPVPVTGNRITIFQYKPQAPIGETLEFKTDILKNNDGTEQRVRVREAPRQLIQFTVRTDADRTRDTINSVLYDWQARVFGVPIWFEQRPLEADIPAAGTNIQVDTADADYRDDSLVMVYTDNFNFEVLEIDSFTATDITTKTPFAGAFSAANSVVAPVRTAITSPNLKNGRFAIGPSDFEMEFEVLDNVPLDDASAFPSYQGKGQSVAKPFLDSFNFLPGRNINDGIRRRVIRLDVKTGPPTQYSPWAKGKPLYQFGHEAIDLADVWTWRQLMHYLHGSQLSFYVPTGRFEFDILTDMGAGGNSFDFVNMGFTDFVQEVTPRSDIRILRKDGTYSLHEIATSVVISPTVERVTIVPVIGPALLTADVERIEYVTLSRIDADRVTIQHRRPGTARLQFTLIGVPA